MTFITLILLCVYASAQDHSAHHVDRDMAKKPNWMLHSNLFLVQSFQEGPRGDNKLSAPNMFMADVGQPLSDKHYFDVNLMLTLERWTFPEDGHPQLLQIGEENDDVPYIDHQHPHSSPIMGLTFSDTIKLDDKENHIKIFFAPRGQATEGPIPFMHRPTGQVNPDPPLGHHIGQDVSHITSTVLGFSLALRNSRYEVSAFHGREPSPTDIDLPLGPLDSYAVRFGYDFSEKFSGMISASRVTDPEEHDIDLDHIDRYSASFYSQHDIFNEIQFKNAFIFGLINGYDHISALQSYLDEFWFSSDSPHNYWGRIEFVERAPVQLAIATADAYEPKFVTALTAGYTYKLKSENNEYGLGLSTTKNFLPSEFSEAYGGNPWTSRIFLQWSGAKSSEN